MERYKIFGYTLLVIVVIFWLCIYSHFRAQQIHEDYSPLGKFISIEDINLHYTRKGSGSSVVLLYGRDGVHYKSIHFRFLIDLLKKRMLLLLIVVVVFKENGQRLSKSLPNGELIGVEGAGHKLHHTYSDLVIEVINDVVQKTD